MEANQQPGDAEAAGAIAGMQDLYGRRLTKGDPVRYRLSTWPAGRSDGGTVLGFHRGRILVETETDIVELEVDDLLPF